MRYILLIFVSGLALNLFSQIDKPIKKGNILLGGSIGADYATFKSDNSDSNNESYYLAFSPSMGYFFINNLAVGTNLRLSYNLGKYSNSTSEEFSIGLGPYVKYYSDKGIILGLDISVLGSFNKLDLEYSPTTYKYLVYEINPSIGYAFFINQKVSLETNLNYQYQRYDGEANKINSWNNRLFLNIGFQIFL